MRDRSKTSRRWVFGLALIAAVGVDACGSGGGIVGGECMSGYAQCGDKCVDLSTDPANCGACGRVCDLSQACISGICSGPVDQDGGSDGFVVETGSGGGPLGDAGEDSQSGAGGTAGSQADGGQTGGVGGSGGSAAGGSGGSGTSGEGGAYVGGSAGSGDGGSGVSGAGGTPTGGTGGSSAGGAAGVGGTGGDILDAGADAASDGSDLIDSEPDVLAEASDSADSGADAADDSAPDAASEDAWDDAFIDASDAADASEADSCVPPYDNALNCGACGVRCQAPLPVCKADGDGGFACAEFCDPGLTQCGSECVDLLNDGENCGACGTVCPTGLCQAGKCRGTLVGNVVVMGMNFRTWTADSPPVRAFANAAFLPPHNPVRIAMYTEYADATMAQVSAVLEWGSGYKGRAYEVTDLSSSSDVVAGLSIDDDDVLLIHDQPNAPAGELASVGTALQATISSYVRSGGTVLVLASRRGQNEMPSLLTQAGLLETTDLVSVSWTILENLAPADVVGVNVQSPFLARLDTVSFVTPEAGSAFLTYVVGQQVDAGEGAPVVLHRIVPP